MATENGMQQLRAYLAPVADLIGVQSVLAWDQETMMPSGGVRTRADQMGTLAGEIHRRYVAPELSALLDRAAEEADEREALIIRAVRRSHELRSRVPAELVVRRTELSARAKESWKEARKTNEFQRFAPDLQEQFALAREIAGHIGFEKNPYDALLDGFEPGLTYEWITTQFAGIKAPLRDLIHNVGEATKAHPGAGGADNLARRTIDPDKQLAFSRTMAELVSYDFEHGRLDLSTHPFTSGGSFEDVRLTTRVISDYFPSCLFATLHEAGHGIHGQNLDPELYRLPFRYGLAIAESQSRFFENHIGRSRPFWEGRMESLQAAVPELADASVDQWYRAINTVSPSLIRVEADEVTYGMHIMLRFELENSVINGDLTTDDLPHEWNRSMTENLGVTPKSDTEGVLQDIHWSQAGIGYFPDYLLGSMLSAQLWSRMDEEISNTDDLLRAGTLEPVTSWLRDRVQRHGGLYTFAELARGATGSSFSSEFYMSYLTRKFSEIYEL